MSKQEIIEKLKELLEQPALSVQKEVKQLEKEYKKTWTEEFEKAKQTFIDEGGKAKDFVYTETKEDEQFKELIKRFEKKKKEEEKKLETLQESNKRKKEELIGQLEVLAEADIKDITPIVKKLRKIQNKWKEIKELKKSDYNELQRKYNLLLDKINENIKAFNKLQEYNYEKNTELKEELLRKMEALLQLDDYRKIEELFKIYKKEWKQIGDVLSEKYAEIKSRFDAINQKINEKLDAFYATLEEEKKKNLNRKNELLKELEAITEKLKNNENILWKEINEKVQSIQQEWLKIRHIPANLVKEVQEKYNVLLGIYYDAKRKHQEYIQKKQEEIKQLKEKLLNEVQQLIESKDIDVATQRVIQIQQEWKKFYLRNKEENQQLNQKFKETCDAFFEKKKDIEKERIQQEKDNLVKKLELINRLKHTEFDKNNPEEALQKIQEFIKEFNSIGHVPIEEKDKVYDEFFGKINQLYADLQLSEEKRQSILYKSKLQQLVQSSTNPIEALSKEEKFIKRKISDLENELIQIDNNLAFFKNATSDNPLLKEAFEKKEKVNRLIEEWKLKLNIVRGMLSEYKKVQQQNPAS